MVAENFIKVNLLFSDVVQIILAEYIHANVNYRILNNNGDTLRKGSFNGMSTNIRIVDLPDGLYHLIIDCLPTYSVKERFIKNSTRQIV